MFPSLARAALLLVAIVMILGGIVGLALRVPLFGPLIGGLLLLVGVLFERWRYKPVETAVGPRFKPTGERFVDPTSKIPVRVYADARTGERRYVEDAGS
jgi:hypothetical protein